MDKYRCIIIEDEPLALERTQSYVHKVPSLDLVATFDNALEGLAYLQQQTVDILLLDINMDELSGIDLLERARLQCQIIITTAYQQYALKGYELNVTDYLLKPFTFPRFLQAIDKSIGNLTKSDSPKSTGFFFVKTENRLEKIRFADLRYIEGMRDYRRIHTTQGSVMTLQTFTELAALIPSQVACRVHKSYMVALAPIEAIERGRVIMGQQRIPISATYRTAFYELINAK